MFAFLVVGLIVGCGFGWVEIFVEWMFVLGFVFGFVRVGFDFRFDDFVVVLDLVDLGLMFWVELVWCGFGFGFGIWCVWFADLGFGCVLLLCALCFILFVGWVWVFVLIVLVC